MTIASRTHPRRQAVAVLLFLVAHLAWMAAPSSGMPMPGEELHESRAGSSDAVLATEPMACPGGLGGCMPLWTSPGSLLTSDMHAESAALPFGTLVLEAADARRLLAQGPGPPPGPSLQVLLQVFRP